MILKDLKFKRLEVNYKILSQEQNRNYVFLNLGSHMACQELGDLNNQHLFLIVMEAGKYENKVPTDSISGKRSPPGLQKVAFLLCPHTVKRGSLDVYSFSHKCINAIIATRETTSKPNYL